MFVTDTYFQLSLIFAGKAGGHPNAAKGSAIFLPYTQIINLQVRNALAYSALGSKTKKKVFVQNRPHFTSGSSEVDH